jgi:hypothetical protein
MSASISQNKGWGGARFDDRLGAQGGNHPVFRIPAAIPSSKEVFYKTIDDFSGYLYPQPRYISSWACGKLSSNEICDTVKIPLDFLNSWPPWPFENPIER